MLGPKSLGGNGDPRNVGEARKLSGPLRRAEGVAGTLGRSSDASAPAASDLCSTPLSCRLRAWCSSPKVVVSAATLLTGKPGAGLDSRWLGAGGGNDDGRDESADPSFESDDFLDRPLVESREDLGMTDNFTGAAEAKLTTARRSDHVARVDFLAGKFPRLGGRDHQNSCTNREFLGQESTS